MSYGLPKQGFSIPSRFPSAPYGLLMQGFSSQIRPSVPKIRFNAPITLWYTML